MKCVYIKLVDCPRITDAFQHLSFEQLIPYQKSFLPSASYPHKPNHTQPTSFPPCQTRATSLVATRLISTTQVAPIATVHDFDMSLIENQKHPKSPSRILRRFSTRNSTEATSRRTAARRTPRMSRVDSRRQYRALYY